MYSGKWWYSLIACSNLQLVSPNGGYHDNIPIILEKSAVLNWWDITEKEGCCSLNTRMKVLVTAVGMDSATELVKPLI